MPIKEIMIFTAGVLATLFATYGPSNFSTAIKKTKVEIIREVSRTNNWGNPSIFRDRSMSHVK